MPAVADRRISRRCFMAAAAVLVPSPRAFAAVQSSWTAAKASAIENLIEAEMTKARIPAVSLAVVADGRLAWARGFGFADLEHRVPATPQTVYRIASVSKPLTATAAMQLAERGKLDLDGPIQRYVPSFPVKQWPLTARHLLQHTGGVRHYRPDEDVNRRHYATVAEALNQFRDDPLLFEPGTNFRYTSLGFVLLGAVIEGAAGMPYADYVRSNVLEPCGMRNTRPDDPEAVIPNRARGYRLDSAGTIVNCVWVDQSNKLPGGGWLSTVEDLARFAIAVESDTLLRSDTKKQMWDRVRTNDGRQMDYSKGWMSAHEGGSLVSAGHGGNQQGAMATFNIEPQKEIATALLMNSESYQGIWQLTGRVSEIAARQA
jgi:serine beta-lactamase-like protein LACTB